MKGTTVPDGTIHGFIKFLFETITLVPLED